MSNIKSGFVLLEAVLTVVIVSICLTFIAQALLNNFRTGIRFQETARALMVMQNRLGLVLATSGSDDVLDTSPVSMDKPYERYTVAATTDKIDDHLKRVGLELNWPQGRNQGRLDTTTIIYNPDEIPSS